MVPFHHGLILKFGFVIFLQILLFPQLSYQQNMGSTWIIGFDNNQISDPKFGMTTLDFSEQPLKQTYMHNEYHASSGFINTSISEIKGKILLFTDGLNIYGRNLDIIENGEELNPGEVRNDFSSAFYPVAYNHILLPRPGYDDQYVLFHFSVSYNRDPGDQIRSVVADKFLLTSIYKDKLLDDFKVGEKNNLILAGNFNNSHLAYCRHANGRDWWLVFEKYNSNKHYIYLLDPSGIKLYAEQEIGIIGGKYDWSGNSIFSPDGTMYIKYCFDYGIQLFNFDRCSGSLSNSIQLKTYVNPELKEASIAVSSNSRFLYINDYTRIWQYDLDQINVPGFIDTIGFWDGYFIKDVLTTGFYQMALADDGKIYLSCHSGNIYLHCIDKPNEKGLASDFKLRNIILECWMAGGLPIMPNYQLGPVNNSVCDSLSYLAKHDWTNTFKIYPNPTTDEIYFSNADTTLFPDLIIDIYDGLGKKVKSQTLQTSTSQLPISLIDLPAALYFMHVSDYKGRTVNRKIVKL
ncbi:MAG: T9SS type A sorting domain-containing protein [Saprospiraceae bacterium]